MCIHETIYIFQIIRMSSMFPPRKVSCIIPAFCPYPFSHGNHWPVFCHQVNVLPFLEIYMSKIIESILIFVWLVLFSTIILRFTHVHISSSFLFIFESHFGLWIFHNLFIHSASKYPTILNVLFLFLFSSNYFYSSL